MRHISGYIRLLPMLAVVVCTSGCMPRGAPSFILFGAYFPAWMLVAGIGILAAICVRIAMVASGLAEVVPMQLLVCVSAGLTVAVLVWASWFGA